MKKISPYSEEGIFIALNNYLVKEWRGLSLVKSFDGKKDFSHLIKYVISESLLESNYMFEDHIVDDIEDLKNKRINKYKEFNVKTKETKKLEDLEKNLLLLDSRNKTFDLFDFVSSIKERLKLDFIGVEKISPKKITEITDETLKEDLLKIKTNKKARFDMFNGLSSRYRETFHFIDAISAPIVYYGIKEEGKDELDFLLFGITSYVLKVNETKNSKRLSEKLSNIEKNNLKHNHKDFSFFHFENIKDDLKYGTETKNHKQEIGQWLQKRKE